MAKVWTICALAALIIQPKLVEGCCAVSSGLEVIFKGQRNLIVWDPATKTEHFVRQATFTTDAPDLGFIAPTPTVPQLDEADPQVFEIIRNLEPKPEPGSKSSEEPTGEAAAAAPIEVIQAVEVAGYEAVTVKATDASALAKWMRDNKFETNESVETWTKFYIDQEWYLTLFKVKGQGREAATGLVRMSFKTDKPFNPYYVPEVNWRSRDEWTPDGGLSVSFIAPARYGPVDEPDSMMLSFAVGVPDKEAKRIASMLKIGSLPKGATLAVFRDESFPSQESTRDLFFEQKGPALPPESRSSPWSFLLGAGAVLLGLLLVVVVFPILIARFAAGKYS